jgi:hypothetical protein
MGPWTNLLYSLNAVLMAFAMRATINSLELCLAQGVQRVSRDWFQETKMSREFLADIKVVGRKNRASLGREFHLFGDFQLSVHLASSVSLLLP